MSFENIIQWSLLTSKLGICAENHCKRGEVANSGTELIQNLYLGHENWLQRSNFGPMGVNFRGTL